MGAVAARDVDAADAFVTGEIGALRRAAVHEADPVAGDEVGEDVLEVRAQVGVDGVHLGDDDLAVHVELVQDVERGDGGDVARSQHQCHTRASGPAPVLPGRALAYLLGAGAQGSPDLGGEAVEQQPVPSGGRKDVDHSAAVPLVHGPGVQGGTAGGYAPQDMQIGPGVLRQGPGPAHPVLGGPRGGRAVALGLGAGRGHAVGGGDHPRQQPFQ
ncbi:hypothetical protein [Streptomyces sp. NPDC005568]|uniref:hypothetical protein n=1 Tax=Streptomyces sp. NPDC005568 TaxID=3156887 RepID=UPI0033BE2FCC